MVAADLDGDGDGDQDVISASIGDNTISWYESSGGAAPEFTRHVITTRAVVAADLNGDGAIDVLTALAGDNKAAWHQNQGQPTPAFTSRTITTSFVTPEDVTTGDLDNDGDLDVIMASSGDDVVTWFENDGGGIPRFDPDIVSTSISGPVSVVAADFSGDGRIDIAAVTGINPWAYWFINEDLGGPVFNRPPFNRFSTDVGSIIPVDFDFDGNVDMVSTSARMSGIVWHRNTGLTPTGFESNVLVSPDAIVTSIFTVDMDADGDLDLISGSPPNGFISWHEHESKPPPPLPFTVRLFDAAIQIRALHPADLDGDNDIDIIIGERFVPGISWYENMGGSPPSFERSNISSNIGEVRSISTADLDGDADLDITVVNAEGNAMVWFENNGGAPDCFPFYNIETPQLNIQSIAFPDLDGDSDIDILSVSPDDSRIAWYENDGESPPNLSSRTVTASAFKAYFVFPADFDNDGDLDVLSSSGKTFTWYENNGERIPFFRQHFQVVGAFSSPISIYPVDFDNDNDLDILT